MYLSAIILLFLLWIMVCIFFLYPQNVDNVWTVPSTSCVNICPQSVKTVEKNFFIDKVIQKLNTRAEKEGERRGKYFGLME